MPDRDYTKLCRHRLVHATECAAGVNYADLALSHDLKPKECKAQICMGIREGCSLYAPYTPEEIAAEEQKERDFEADWLKVRAIVVEKTQGKLGVWGHLDSCPICQHARLWYDVCSWHGHIGVRCESGTCIKHKEECHTHV